jgi:amino acid adenylation domain-containing protein
VEGIPQPVVSKTYPQLNVVDLQNVPLEQREETLSRLAQQEARASFDLSSGPLLRGSLCRVAPSEYTLLLVAHRILCDPTSLEVLLQQLASRYGATQIGKWDAAPAPMKYSEYVSHQNEMSEEHLAYWKQRLADAPITLDLPFDRPRPPEQTFCGASHCFSIEHSVLERLRNLGKNQGTTLFMTLFAAFNVLLSRYSRQNDVLVGTAVVRRDDPRLENIVGPIENMIVLRTDLSGDPSFSELLTRIRGVINEAFSHQDLAFEVLLEHLPIERDLSRNPLFQVVFGLRQERAEPCWAGGIRTSRFEVDSGSETFDLALDLTEAADAIHGKLKYSTDLWDAATIARMTEHFGTLVSSIATDPQQRVCELSILTESERRKILVEFNATWADYRRDLCLHDFFGEQVNRTPEATAVVCGKERLSYRELNDRANRLAHYLRRQGVRPEVLVGICAERSIELLVGILGILKAGAAYVPLDPAYPKDRLAVILEDAKAPILLTQHRLRELLPKDLPRVISLDTDWPDIANEPETNPTCNATSSNLAYVLFTSGSTGRPKGVALEHRSAATFVQWAREVFLPAEIAGTLFSTSVCFDLSVFEMFVPLSMSGAVIIAQNALELPKLAAAHEVTLINTVPSAIAELVRMGGVPPSVQVINLAGEALPTRLTQQIYRQTAVSKVYNLYGPTEDTTYSTYTLVPRDGEVTIGRPLPNTQVYILDESRQPVPIGVPGELYLAGDGLARGYFGRQDLTTERFIPNPFSSQPGMRMYRTGDLARFLEDGNIQYLGRIDNQVKIRGFRIELEEIEKVLAQHPAIQSAVVLAREDTPGDKRLVAYVVPSTSSISAPLLQDLVRQRLPEYMVPSAFVELNRLPLSPNGKINRRLLPAPDKSALEGGKAVRPRDELESMLVEIWQKVLGVAGIGIRDDFFALGGHSLMAARVLTEVERKIGKDLPLSALFRGATVESLARLIRDYKEAADPVVLEIQHAGESGLLPFFAIVPPGEESLGYAMLARHMGVNQTVYKIQGHAPVLGGKRPYSEQEMQDLTDEYIGAIRAVQPRGPYCLGGLCEGTQIAERIVLTLESQGEEVGLFAIFDTWVLQNSQIRWLWKVDYYRQRLLRMMKASLAERISFYKRTAANYVDILRGKKTARTDWEDAYWPEHFTPMRFRAPVVLFKRPKQPFFYVNDPQMGWGARTETGVEIFEVNFHHEEILREPHVRQFGEKLAECMARVSARNHLTLSLVETHHGGTA